MQVERYERAERSGGGGRVLEPATVSLLTDRPAASSAREPQRRVGHRWSQLLGEGAEQSELPPKTTLRLAAGDVVTVVRPGGAGWGAR